jgi:hypothetical protein
MKEGDILPESDFACLTPSGAFIQLQYNEEIKEPKPYIVTPGIWSIGKTMVGLKLERTSFVSDAFLPDLFQTKAITDKIDCFFNRLHIYKDHGIEIPKRSLLLFGPAGTGKSVTAVSIINKYNSQ